MRVAFRVLILVALCLLSACSMPRLKSTKINELRLVDPSGLQIIAVDLPRERLANVLSNEELTRRLRVVEMTTSPSGVQGVLREYRLFDIRTGSVYSLLGLQNADVLVAMNGYVPAYPAQFKDFVRLMVDEPLASVEIRRGGQPMRFDYTIGVEPSQPS